MLVYLIFVVLFIKSFWGFFSNEPDVPTKEYEQEPVVVKEDG